MDPDGNTDKSVPELIGRYRVTAKLGEGGMGVVYLAYDAKLQRSVAIKMLSDVSDPAARKRLLQEARTASALNHPHICTVHEVDDGGPQAFIVMEHVEGKPLSEVIPSAGFAPEAVLHHGLTIADALAHAHERAIVHGDVKASNVLVTPQGRAKVVDFGMATRVAGHDQTQIATQSTALLPETGIMRGTLPYMAPEQLRGAAGDARSDVWALGVLLYEMTAGRRPFSGQTSFELTSAIISQDPASLPHKAPPPLRAAIERCLEKSPERRYQQAGEVRAALEAIQTGRSRMAWRPPLPGRRWAWAALMPVLLAAAFLGWRMSRPPQPTEPLEAVPLTTLPGVEVYPSLSPEGNYVAFAWNGPTQDNYDIYIQMIGSGAPLRLTIDPSSEQSPVWSPDGRWIAFLRGDAPSRLALDGTVELRLIPPLGGPERKVADIHVRAQPTPPGYLAWCPDSSCLIVTDEQGERKPLALFVVSLDTGEKRRLTDPPPSAIGDSNPSIAPDGRALVFQRQQTGASAELYSLPLGKGVTSAGDDPKRLTIAALNAVHPVWAPDGNDVIFSARGSLWRVGASGERPPTRLPFVGEDGLWPVIAHLPSSRPPRLVYVRSLVDANIWRIETAAPGLPAASAPIVSIASTRGDMGAEFSPDGRRVAFVSDRGGTPELWLADRDGSNAVQLTSIDAPAIDTPRWAPDGQTIAFDSNPDGQRDVYIVPANGGSPRRLTSDPAIDILPSFSKDGKWIYFCSTRGGERQLWKIPASGGKPVQITRNVAWAAAESPDGAYIYYTQTSGPEPSPLWRVPSSGGDPVKVLDGVTMRGFAILERGIYYFDRPAREYRLQYFNFGTGTSTVVARDLGEIRSYLTASPDGRTLLYTRIDSSVDDLMLVENFR
jgi:Tol biopolymer transport system component/predicted Ser/Thr protein kinase